MTTPTIELACFTLFRPISKVSKSPSFPFHSHLKTTATVYGSWTNCIKAIKLFNSFLVFFPFSKTFCKFCFSFSSWKMVTDLWWRRSVDWSGLLLKGLYDDVWPVVANKLIEKKSRKFAVGRSMIDSFLLAVETRRRAPTDVDRLGLVVKDERWVKKRLFILVVCWSVERPPPVNQLDRH